MCFTITHFLATIKNYFFLFALPTSDAGSIFRFFLVANTDLVGFTIFSADLAKSTVGSSEPKTEMDYISSLSCFFGSTTMVKLPFISVL